MSARVKLLKPRANKSFERTTDYQFETEALTAPLGARPFTKNNDRQQQVSIC